MFDTPKPIVDFLAQDRVAVVGVSRNRTEAANVIYRKLRDAGHDVRAVNPRADRVEGDVCYPGIADIPERVDAAVVVTPPEASEDVVMECAACGISRVWLHRNFGSGSVSERAVRFCRENEVDVIAGGCPMMFCKPVDLGHACMRWVLGATGRLPN